ncbi:MAG: ArsA family ATPase [Ornithinimicrobium sp.]
MLLGLAAQRRVLFVGGKGGVGKTTVASAVALARARAGARVLLISTDPAHNLGHLFGVPVGDGFTPIVPGLEACELDPEKTMDTHLAAAERTMRRLMPDHLGAEVTKHLRLARQAPGAAEAAVLERLADVVEGARQVYDLVVIDTAPSGHTVRMLSLPQVVTAWTAGLLDRQDTSKRFADAMTNLDRRRGRNDPGAEVVPRGQGTGTTPSEPAGASTSRSTRDAEIRDILLRRQERFTHLRHVITDREHTAFVVVLAAERLPVLETVELERDLARVGSRVDALVVNKRSPRDAGALLAARHKNEEEHLAVLWQALPDVATTQVPLLGQDVSGVTGLDAMVRWL